MPASPIARLIKDSTCDVRGDDLTRQLYATDASLYQVVPQAVAFPKSADEVASVVQAADAAGIAITPRGAGTGLAGGALGEGLVIDLSRYNRGIHAFNPEAKTVRVEAGVVLDQLNAWLAPHGLGFGPDVATSSRATLGGMIANNSSGARAPLYGTTIDHVTALESVLPDGRSVTLQAEEAVLKDLLDTLDPLIRAQAPEIQQRFHDRICKRWPGYAVDRYLRFPTNPALLMGGSEGTLATFYSAELNLVPLPKTKSLALIYFASLEEAMQATVELLPLAPASIEHIDDVLFNQTSGRLPFKAARELMQLDSTPCKSILIVEFYDDDGSRMAALQEKQLGLRTQKCADATAMAHVLNLRKAGLSLLTGRKGPAKPVAGIEDVAVPPERLPDFVRGMRGLLDPEGIEASYYGHAASGLLHIRPVIDMHKGDEIARYRRIAEGVAALSKEFDGSLTAEHGVGIARTEFIADLIGPELMTLMRRIKDTFDPEHRMNPGKIFDDGRYRFDTNLRQGAGAAIDLPFEPMLAFAAKDASFVGNLEQCNGCGGCRKDTPTMCPTFIATGEEIMSTRGRANTIRAVLEARMGNGDYAVLSEELDEAISNCLSCKACATECPSNVDMALLKAELLYARIRREGVSLSARVISRMDLMSRFASLAPGLANASLNWPWLRQLMRKSLGISARRPLPTFAAQRFDTWFRQRTAASSPRRGTVILWDDCWVRHNEPGIGKAAVAVLEAAGYQVELLNGRACCGRPAFSAGRLDVAQRMGETNLKLLQDRSEAILFLEPSCYSMFKKDYAELKLDGAAAVAERVYLFEEFVDTLLDEDAAAIEFDTAARAVAIHAHCHAKAITDERVFPRLAERIPNSDVTLLDTGCCGMAGQFGALEQKYDLSLQVAQNLVRQTEALPEDTHLVASGTSCRHQLTHLTDRHPLHMAELLAEALHKK